MKKIISLFTILLFTFTVSNAGPIRINDINADGKPIGGVFDLTNPKTRKQFRKDFAELSRFRICFNKADYAVTLFYEREAGVSEEKHLADVKAKYETTQTESLGAVSWYVYLDFQRMIRDLHRRSGQATYYITDADYLWEREFKWCAF